MIAATIASVAFALFVIGLVTDLHASTLSREHPRFWLLRIIHTVCFVGLTILLSVYIQTTT